MSTPDDLDEFNEHLKDVKETVSTWPEWKRNALGIPVDTNDDADTGLAAIERELKKMSRQYQHQCPCCGSDDVQSKDGTDTYICLTCNESGVDWGKE